jgi:nitrogen fixation protein FixH
MNAPRPITGRTVLWGLLGFFGTIFAVNGVFVYYALDSWPGLGVQNAYERGLNYNKILDAAAEQAAKGWRSEVAILEDGARRRIEVRLTGKDGTPLAGLEVKAPLSRPTHEGMDAALKLAAVSPGIYDAELKLREPGRWNVEIKADSGGAQVYRMVHAISVRP